MTARRRWCSAATGWPSSCKAPTDSDGGFQPGAGVGRRGDLHGRGDRRRPDLFGRLHRHAARAASFKGRELNMKTIAPSRSSATRATSSRSPQHCRNGHSRRDRRQMVPDGQRRHELGHHGRRLTAVEPYIIEGKKPPMHVIDMVDAQLLKIACPENSIAVLAGWADPIKLGCQQVRHRHAARHCVPAGPGGHRKRRPDPAGGKPEL
jgi:hypothetical protein